MTAAEHRDEADWHAGLQAPSSPATRRASSLSQRSADKRASLSSPAIEPRLSKAALVLHPRRVGRECRHRALPAAKKSHRLNSYPSITIAATLETSPTGVTSHL